MTIKECIDIVDNIKPNQYTIKDKVMWLSFIDGIIINEVLKTHEGYDGRYDLFEGYTEDKLSESLIVPSPYDRLYTAYLKMRIDGENGETARYNNSMVLYNTYMQEYRKHYNKTHMPLDTTSKRMDMKPPAKPTPGLTDAEYENIKRDLTFILTEYFSDTVSPDKLNDAINKYLQNNAEAFKGKDGHTPKRGVDYWTDEDVTEIRGYSETVAKKTLKIVDKSLEITMGYAEKMVDKAENMINDIKSAKGSNSVYAYKLTSDEYSAEDIFVVNISVQDGKTELGFAVYGSKVLFRIGDSVVFYNPITGRKIVGECSGYLNNVDGTWEFNMIVDEELPEMTQDKFLETYTHYGHYSGTYYWESKEKLLAPVEEKIGDIDKALDEIIAIQNGILEVGE